MDKNIKIGYAYGNANGEIIKLNKKFNVIVPIVAKDIVSLKMIFKFWKKYLPIKKLIFIAREDVLDLLRDYPYYDVEFINEEDIISYETVKNIISELTQNDEKAVKRTGWYLQQFIKMEYARYCADEYYLVWDSDTAPLKMVNMFIEGQPAFDMKTEKHIPYFNTIEKILDGTQKAVAESFVSEHMLINTSIMIELLEEINRNKNLSGSIWYEKILRSVDTLSLSGSGFSEFETYGTYCVTRHPRLYKLRKWTSLREGSQYFEISRFTDKKAGWLAREFDAVSFEKGQPKNKKYRWFSCGLFYKFMLFSELRMHLNQ